MDPQTPGQPVQSPTPQPENPVAASPSLARMILVSLAVLTVGLAIAYGGFYYGQRSQKMQQIAPTVTVSPSQAVLPTITASPSATPSGVSSSGSSMLK